MTRVTGSHLPAATTTSGAPPPGWPLRTLLPLLVVTAALPGCPQQELCTTEAVPAVEVRVRDGSSQRELCDATVVLRSDGTFEERPTAQGSPCVYQGAYERPGTYTIDVSRTGYRSARRTGVKVEQDNCHVMTQQVTVDLSP